MKQTLKKKLQTRFVLLTLLCLFLIQSLIVCTSIYQNYRDLVAKSDMLISQLHSHHAGSNRYFSVKIPAGKDTVYPDAIQNVNISVQEASDYAQKALAGKQERGFIGGYRYRIYQNENGTKIYFLLRESGIEMCTAAAENMIGVSLAGLIVVGILLIPVSGWVTKPLVENHQKQKRFITSASHELKTPLTVINTNAQLLESEIGKNIWLEGIQKQVSLLTKMTQDLVTLSKAEEYFNPLIRETFSFSETLSDAIKAYQSVKEQRHIEFSHLFQDEIRYCGSKKEVRQLIGILLDNAFKYCPENGSVSVKAKETRKGVWFTITNTAKISQNQNIKHLADRFQRGENAADKDGFGLGLSIAKAITERHNGHLLLSIEQDGQFRAEVVLK